MEATLTFITKELAENFATAWSRHTLKGHIIGSGTKNVKVSIYDITEDEKIWVDDYVLTLKNSNENNEFNYMMLGRLKQDCEYFLGYGSGCVKHLYYDSVKEHISEMKKLWCNFIVKPEWLTYEDIEDYEKRMDSFK